MAIEGTLDSTGETTTSSRLWISGTIELSVGRNPLAAND